MDIKKIKESFYKYVELNKDDNVDMSVSYYDKDGRKITLTYKGDKKNAISKKKSNNSSGSN